MPKRDPDTLVRHAFVRDGRLTSLPSRRPMLLAALADDGPDPATLRRHLVDEDFLERVRGVYRRPSE